MFRMNTSDFNQSAKRAKVACLDLNIFVCSIGNRLFQHIQLAEHKSFHPAVELPATDAVDGIHHVANRTGYIAH